MEKEKLKESNSCLIGIEAYSLGGNSSLPCKYHHLHRAVEDLDPRRTPTTAIFLSQYKSQIYSTYPYLYPQISVASIPHQRCFLFHKIITKNPQMAEVQVANDCGFPVTSDKSSTQPLYLKMRGHYGRGGNSCQY